MTNKTVYFLGFLSYLIGALALPVLALANGIDPKLDWFLGMVLLFVYGVIIYRTYKYYYKWKSVR